MDNSNKTKSINKRLSLVFKDLKTMPFEDVNKILFNIELLKNKYLYRKKQKKIKLYEVNIREIINKIKQEKY